MGQRGKDEHKMRTQMQGDQIQLRFIIPLFPKLAGQTNLGFPSSVDLFVNWVHCCQTDLWDILSNTPKGALVFIKTGFRLAVNFEDIWLIMIGSVNDRDICLWSQCGSIDQREIGFQQNQESHNCLWLNEKETKTYKKFPCMIYLLLGLFRSVRQNPKA